MCGYEEIYEIYDDTWGYEINGDRVEIVESKEVYETLLKVDRLINSFNIKNVGFYQRKGDGVREGRVILDRCLSGVSYYRGGFKSDTVNAFFGFYSKMESYENAGWLKNKAYSPNITAYLKWMDDVKQVSENFNSLMSTVYNPKIEGFRIDYVDYENRLYDCFNKLYDRLSSQGFIRLKNKVRKSCNKNYKSMLSYIDRAFDKCSRLLVVRVDLNYSEKYNKEIERKIRENNDGAIDEEEFIRAKMDMTRLLANRRNNKIFDGLIGYMWKLEFGLTRRYHFHVVFLYDNSKRYKDKYLAKCIGEYWRDRITEGRGSYYNANTSNVIYKHDARGAVHETDWTKRKGLVHIAKYFSKADYFIRLEIPKKLKRQKGTIYRTLGKGQIKMPCRKRGGRPRGQKIYTPYGVS